MTQPRLSGLTEENLVARRRPFVVRPGRLDAVTRPFQENGGVVVELDVSGLGGHVEFLRLLHEKLPLPFGGVTNWDAWADSYEEMAEEWGSPTMLALTGFDTLSARKLQLAMELVWYLMEAWRAVGGHGTPFIPLFCQSPEESRRDR